MNTHRDQIVELLLEYKADVNKVNLAGRNALHEVASLSLCRALSLYHRYTLHRLSLSLSL